jgi:hypothetical protein
MQAINSYRLERYADYVVLRMWFAKSADDHGTDAIEVMLPITVLAGITVDSLSALYRSTADLTKFFADFEEKLNSLNAISAEVERQKAEITNIGKTGGE